MTSCSSGTYDEITPETACSHRTGAETVVVLHAGDCVPRLFMVPGVAPEKGLDVGG